MTCDRLQTAACEVVLGLVPSGGLAGTAVAALEDGYDSPSLRVLAGLTSEAMEDAGALFGRALAELPLPLPTGREAVLCLARNTAKAVLGGAMSPHDGARHIWEVSLRLPAEHVPELDTFVYAASEWPDRPDEGDMFADGVRAAARELLDGEGSLSDSRGVEPA